MCVFVRVCVHVCARKFTCRSISSAVQLHSASMENGYVIAL